MDPADCADPLSISWEALAGAEPRERGVSAGRTQGGGANRPAALPTPVGNAGNTPVWRALPTTPRSRSARRGGKLYIEMGDPAAAAYRGYYYVRRAAAHLVVINDGFHIPLRHLQRRGLGLHILHRQVAAAAALGVDRIEVRRRPAPRRERLLHVAAIRLRGRLAGAAAAHAADRSAQCDEPYWI